MDPEDPRGNMDVLEYYIKNTKHGFVWQSDLLWNLGSNMIQS